MPKSPKIVSLQDGDKPSKKKKMKKQRKLAIAAYEFVTQAAEASAPKDDEDRSEEQDFVISLIVNMLVNREYCVDCFMNRTLAVIGEIKSMGMFHSHNPEKKDMSKLN